MKIHLKVMRYFKPRRLHRTAAQTFSVALPVAAVLTLTFAAFVLGWWKDSVRLSLGGWSLAALGSSSKSPRTEREPLVMLKRELSAVILKAANDVRWGRPAVAVAELESAAARLDPRYNNDLDLDPVVVANWPASFANLDSEEGEDGWDFAPGGEIPVQPRITEMNLRVSDKDKSTVQGSFAPDVSTGHSFPRSITPAKVEEIPRQNVERQKNVSHESESLRWWSELTHLSSDQIEDKNLPFLVSVLIDGCNISPSTNLQVIDNIQKMWPSLQIKVATSKNLDRKYLDGVRNKPNVTVQYVECRGSGGQIAPLVSLVSTPFVLFLECAAAVTEDLSIKDMLKTVRDTKGVALIGVSERGRDGAWDYICTQLSIKNARLELQQGYHFSRGGCLFCDVTSSSFFAATWILQEEEVDCTLPEHSRQLDWFLRLQRQGILVMTCPYLMTHINRQVMVENDMVTLDRPCVTKSQRIQARDEHMFLKRQYRKLAKKWELTTVVLANNTRLEYSCLEIHFNCQAVSRVKHYTLPNCCLKIKNRMFATLFAVAKKEKVPFEVNSGSLLGAVKFKNAIPWDFDDDAVYRNKDMKNFLKHKQKMRQLGLSPVFKKEFGANNKSALHNYFSMTGQGGFSMDLWGVDKFSSHADVDKLKNIPSNLVCFRGDHSPVTIKTVLSERNSQVTADSTSTDIGDDKSTDTGAAQKTRSDALNNKNQNRLGTTNSPSCFTQSLVKIGQNWLPGPWNPAQAAQSRYGSGLFRHEPHWRMKEQHQTGWSDCPRVGHHACLDLHPMDGSLPFF
ncbi:uncharacterized protein LOC108667930 [Hyalella azteca]|uniref:Uncharacterized protein LOC108667930 n=1 Tax=Hyalella azteca TaxID=294128 RepID=A0A8B7NAB1_HYAAZ|nr:uncharacterized protein LOC108667930 [Hyalella azteca]